MGTTGRQGMIEKRHTCNRCGCVFTYGIDPRHWKTPWMSQTMRPEGSVRCYPCPDCGLYQPEMVMWLKVALPLTLFAAFFGLLTLWAVGMANGGANAVTAAQVGVGLFAVYALFQVGTVFHNPNADLAENRRVAKQMIKERRLEVVNPGDPEAVAPPPRNVGLRHVPGLLLVLAGPAGFVLSILYLSDREPPPANEHCSPSVVVDGARVRLTCTSCTAQGVGGDIWRGTPTVRVLNAKALGLPETLPAEGSNCQWGEKFSVRKNAVNQPIQPVIEFTLPGNAKLANQTVRLAVTMPITYPAMVQQAGLIPDFTSSKKYFFDYNSTVSEQVALKVADEAAVRATRNGFLVGLVGGVGAFLGGMWLTTVAWCLLLGASKSEVVRDGEPGPATEPEADPCPPSRMRNGYELLGLDNPTPAVGDFDRTKWGNRRLR
ncbi:MAG: hypothetical protein U0797_21400 [Gemmataceae bacterium]